MQSGLSFHLLQPTDPLALITALIAKMQDGYDIEVVEYDAPPGQELAVTLRIRVPRKSAKRH
jgi:hypothetical protein